MKSSATSTTIPNCWTVRAMDNLLYRRRVTEFFGEYITNKDELICYNGTMPLVIIGECQWAEAVCETRALQHEKGILTIQDKRNIIKEIKKNYPDMKWRNRRD